MDPAVALDGDRGLSTKRHIEFNPRVIEEGATTEEEGEEEGNENECPSRLP